VALAVAAGLSGIGLAMRGSPPGAAATGESADLEGLSRPYVPPGASEPARSRAETWGDANRTRTATRVTDLPRAAPGEHATVGAAEAKPSDVAHEKRDPSATREAINLAPAVPIAKSEIPASSPAAEPSLGENAAPAAANVGSHVPEENDPPAMVPGSAPNVPAGSTAEAQPASNPPGVAAAIPAAARSKGDFNTQAARESLADAADRAVKCKTIDTPSGSARVAVTFAPNGHVTNVVIDSGAIVGTAAGSCVASKFRQAKVPPFSGESVLVRKNVRF
jgi:hypothetical protein